MHEKVHFYLVLAHPHTLAQTHGLEAACSGDHMLCLTSGSLSVVREGLLMDGRALVVQQLVQQSIIFCSLLRLFSKGEFSVCERLNLSLPYISMLTSVWLSPGGKTASLIKP